jgi:hypothetical protein
MLDPTIDWGSAVREGTNLANREETDLDEDEGEDDEDELEARA